MTFGSTILIFGHDQKTICFGISIMLTSSELPLAKFELGTPECPPGIPSGALGTLWGRL